MYIISFSLANDELLLCVLNEMFNSHSSNESRRTRRKKKNNRNDETRCQECWNEKKKKFVGPRKNIIREALLASKELILGSIFNHSLNYFICFGWIEWKEYQYRYY